MASIKICDMLKRNNLTISLCIPCIPKHIPFLYELLDSAVKQTRLPDEIIIFISEYTDEDAQNLENLLISKYDCLNICIGNTINKQFAGPNRNEALKLSNCSIISFMDADDIMHPRRIELIHNTFSTFNINCVLHHYSNKIQNLNCNEILKINLTYEFNLDIQHGHPSFRREIFFDKNNKIILEYGNEPRAQDVALLCKYADIHYRDIAIIETSLSVYRPHLSSDEEIARAHTIPI
jgi:glycosyltransferase involved in cell wall biosynthesis